MQTGNRSLSHTVRMASRISVAAAAQSILVLLASCGGERAANGPAPEQINGMSVPPAPDPVANRATVAGVDSNANGIRDDIDRLIAAEFGAEPQLVPVATEHARRLQAVMVAPHAGSVDSYIEHVRCMSDKQLLRRLSLQTTAVLDTPQRESIYARSLAGAFVSKEGC